MKKELIVAVIGILAILLICFGLSQIHPNFLPIGSHPFSAAKAPRPAAAKDPVVMRVNGEQITEKEFNLYVAAAPDQVRDIAAGPRGRKLIANQIVTMKVLEQEGHRLGADDDPEVASQVAMVKANVAANYALQKLIGNPTDAQLRAEYEKKRAQITAPLLYHILFSCVGSPIPARSGQNVSCEDAMRKAQRAAASIHSPQQFMETAKSLSDDANTGAQGGLIGPLHHEGLPPAVDQVVFKLKPGEISMPVRTQFGVHVFMIGSPQAEAFEKIRPMLEQQWKQERMKQVVDDAGKKAKVQYDPKFFGPDLGRPDAGRGTKRPS